MMSKTHRQALGTILARLKGAAISWALTGSTSFALQGVPIRPNDIDLQTDESGAYLLAELFASEVISPVQFTGTDHIRSHFGVLRLHGLRVEIMGDVQKRLPDGTWEPPVDVVQHRQYVAFEGWRVPVLTLEYEYQAYLILGRQERAQLLARAIRQESANPSPAEER